MMGKKQVLSILSVTQLKVFNMKLQRRSFLIFILGILLLPMAHPVYSQTATPSVTAGPTISNSQKNESLVQQINELKDKIASRVAQLNLVEKHGVVGSVTESSDTRITLKTYTGEVKIVDVDEITKFSSPSAKSAFGISDVRPGSVLSAIGLYNKQSKHVLARFISSYTLPIFLHGKITEINEDDFTITVPTKEKKEMIVDIETTTRINALTDNKITRSGFTKLNVGDRVDIVGYPAKNEEKRMSGAYILQITTPQNTSPTP